MKILCDAQGGIWKEPQLPPDIKLPVASILAQRQPTAVSVKHPALRCGEQKGKLCWTCTKITSPNKSKNHCISTNWNTHTHTPSPMTIAMKIPDAKAAAIGNGISQ